MKHHITLHSNILTILCLSATIQGCADLEAVGQFAQGAKALSEASEIFYDNSLESDRQLARLSVDLAAANNSPECQKKDGSTLSPWDCAVRGENLLSETRRNRAAVAALAQYAQSLHEIATLDEDAEVEKAARELSGNLSNIATTLDISANSQESALAGAISNVAKIYIDLKARHSVYEKAKHAQEPVDEIIKTLKNDIKRQQQRISIGRINAKATREEWFNAFRKDYQNPNTPPASKAALAIAAGHLVEDELLDQVAEQPNKHLLASLERSADSCLQAHAAIQNPDIGEQAETVKHFVHDAKNLLSSVKRLTD